MIKQFDVVIEKDSEGYFVASVPVLRGCHTQAKSLDVLMERIREAIELCLEVQKDESPEHLILSVFNEFPLLRDILSYVTFIAHQGYFIYLIKKYDDKKHSNRHPESSSSHR
ncbi:MAG: type II toxin-antitoxin system HicB family antitoxin [Methylococcaceae bacterium]